MKIVNPIYDVAFKYMMEDNQIAIDILSAILDKEIVSVEVQAQEFVDVDKANGLRLFRIDFKAVIKNPSGELETVLLEIQKSRKGFEVERFEAYLGLNYLKQNIILNEDGVSKKVGYPITPIYLLGFRLKNIKVPVLKVARQYLNGITKRPLNAEIREDFVEKLSHDLYAIQIPRLKMHVRTGLTELTDLEKILDVFNHKKYKTSDNRIFDYTGDMSNPKVARVVKHLSRAIIDNDNLLHTMLIEDEIEALLEREKIAKERLKKEADESRIAAKAARASAKAAVAEKELAVVEKEFAVAAEKVAVAAKDEAIAEKEEAAQNAAEWQAKFEALQAELNDSIKRK
jgi:Trp operon repressor